MSRARVWTVSLVGAIAVSAGGLTWTGPHAQDEQPPVRCGLAGHPLQPEHPLELNHEASRTIVKTIAMEKEVFACRDESGRVVYVRDVETFIEVVEAVVPGPAVRRVDLGLQVAQCTKDFHEGTVRCRGGAQDRKIALATAKEFDLRRCQPHEDPTLHPRDPVEMETAFLGSQWAKTTKVEKEVLRCGESVVDLYLFTEIVERRQSLNNQIQTMRPFGAPRFFGIVCIKTNPSSTPGTVSTNACYRVNTAGGSRRGR